MRVSEEAEAKIWACMIFIGDWDIGTITWGEGASLHIRENRNFDHRETLG
jgi:hypothetical protein